MINWHLYNILSGWNFNYFYLQFCTYTDISDSAEITPDDISRQCRHMLGKNFNWQLIDNAGGQNPVKFVYTALSSNDTQDGLGNVTVSVSSALCIFVMLNQTEILG